MLTRPGKHFPTPAQHEIPLTRPHTLKYLTETSYTSLSTTTTTDRLNHVKTRHSTRSTNVAAPRVNPNCLDSLWSSVVSGRASVRTSVRLLNSSQIFVVDFLGCFIFPCANFRSPYPSKAQQPQEQRYAFLSVCAICLCVQRDVHACDCTRGLYGHRKRVCTAAPRGGSNSRTFYQLSYSRPL